MFIATLHYCDSAVRRGFTSKPETLVLDMKKGEWRDRDQCERGAFTLLHVAADTVASRAKKPVMVHEPVRGKAPVEKIAAPPIDSKSDRDEKVLAEKLLKLDQLLDKNVITPKHHERMMMSLVAPLLE